MLQIRIDGRREFTVTKAINEEYSHEAVTMTQRWQDAPARNLDVWTGSVEECEHSAEVSEDEEEELVLLASEE